MAEESAQALVVHGATLPLTERARDRWDQESLDLLAVSKAKGADVATLYVLAEMSVRYDLDPWANEIWCANMAGRDGGTGAIAVMVGRDGYMKIAKRDGTFIECGGQAVYTNDHFEAEYVDERTGWKVEHKITNIADRGEPKGAWATLVREGKPTKFFWAALDQFAKDRSKSAWKYEDAMIVKCAQSYLLRTTYNVSGPAPADEIMVGFNPDTDVEGTADEVKTTLPERIAGLFERAAELDPKSWRLNEVEARIFDGAGEVLMDEVRKVERELEAWLEANAPAEEEPIEAPAELVSDADAEDADEARHAVYGDEGGATVPPDAEVVEEGEEERPGEGPPPDEEPPPAAAEAEPADDEVLGLRRRGQALLEKLAAAPSGSREEEELQQELEGVENRLRELGGLADGQTSLDD